jgi:hypothetical protein
LRQKIPNGAEWSEKVRKNYSRGGDRELNLDGAFDAQNKRVKKIHKKSQLIVYKHNMIKIMA